MDALAARMADAMTSPAGKYLSITLMVVCGLIFLFRPKWVVKLWSGWKRWWKKCVASLFTRSH